MLSFVLVFMVLGARLASFVPLSALAGVLVVVCWNMAEKKNLLACFSDWRPACVLIATFGLTLIEILRSVSSPDALWRRRLRSMIERRGEKKGRRGHSWGDRVQSAARSKRTKIRIWDEKE